MSHIFSSAVSVFACLGKERCDSDLAFQTCQPFGEASFKSGSELDLNNLDVKQNLEERYLPREDNAELESLRALFENSQLTL
jgi:hypothetical protein